MDIQVDQEYAAVSSDYVDICDKDGDIVDRVHSAGRETILDKFIMAALSGAASDHTPPKDLAKYAEWINDLAAATYLERCRRFQARVALREAEETHDAAATATNTKTKGEKNA